MTEQTKPRLSSELICPPLIFVDGVHRRERGIHTAHAEHTVTTRGDKRWSVNLAVRRQTIGQLETLIQLGPDVVELGRHQRTQVVLQLLELAIGGIRVPVGVDGKYEWFNKLINYHDSMGMPLSK